MFVLVAKLFSLLLAGVSISKSYVDFRARRESLQLFLFWSITWIGIVVIALYPPIVDILLSRFGGGGAGIGTFFGMSIVFLFFVVYRMYVKLERIEQKLTKTIQEIALRQDWDKK
jgi:hypothetical protein